MMGGLAINVPEGLPKSERFLPSDASGIWFVTDEGLRLLLSEKGTGRNELPILTEEEIKAKSKADGLTKSLVCVQALWFIAQCLTRRMCHDNQIGIISETCNDYSNIPK